MAATSDGQVAADALGVDELRDGAAHDVAAERVVLALALGDAEHALVLPAECQQRAHRRPRTPLRQRAPAAAHKRQQIQTRTVGSIAYET